MGSSIKVTELVAHILKHMTAEEALTKLLASQIDFYEKLRLEKQPEDNPETVSPYFIIIHAALDLGWDFMIEGGEHSDILRGVSVGSQEYLRDLVSKPSVTPEDLGGLLFGIHSHGEIEGMNNPEGIVYAEEDVLKLLKLFNFPDPKWGTSINMETWKKENVNDVLPDSGKPVQGDALPHIGGVAEQAQDGV